MNIQLKMSTGQILLRMFSSTLLQFTGNQMIREWREKFKKIGLEDYKLSAEYLVDSICGKNKRVRAVHVHVEV